MRTYMRSSLSISLIIIGLTLVAGRLAQAQTTPQKDVKVTLSQRVVVGDTTLEPGDYTLREVSPKIIQVLERDKMKAEAAVITINTENQQPSEETKLVLYKFPGSADYYIDKMWIQGMNIGYEFPVPDKFKELKREREETVAGKSVEREHKEGLK